MGKVTAGAKIPGRVCRTLDVGDFSLLHQLTWFNMAIHSNAEYAKGTWFKERSLAGPVIFAVADGLVHHADTIAELLAQDGYEIYAYIGVDRMKITAPGRAVRPCGNYRVRQHRQYSRAVPPSAQGHR
jgi:hypothetical protein